MQLNYGKPPNSHLSTRPGYNGTSIREFTEVFGSEDACLEHIWERRFGSDFICPRCGDKTPWYRRRGKRYFQHGCSHVISPVAGTMMHASKVPLTLWHYALLHHANSAESIDGVFLSRQLGVTQATAYRIQRRIRYQLAALQVMDQPCASQDYVQVRCDYLTRVRTTNTASRNRAWIFLIGSGSAVDVTVVRLCNRRRLSLRSVPA